MMPTSVSPTQRDYIIAPDEIVLVTGSAGFIGSRLVERMLELGFRRLRCFVRPSSNREKINELASRFADAAQIEVVEGNLVSKQDCARAVEGVSLVYHLAAESGKSFAGSVMNCAVTTR